MAAGGGGAWKVAYADFVTAMMAFFLVMWITAQQPEVKEAIADHFSPPLGWPTPKIRLRPIGKSPTQRPLTATGNSPEPPSQRVRGKKPPPIDATAAIYFNEHDAELTSKSREDLERLMPELAGKLQRIEIRGHASRRPLPREGKYQTAWDLCYARCLATLAYLERHGIEAERMRVSLAAGFEPQSDPTIVSGSERDSRVEIFLLGEFVRNTPDLRQPTPLIPASAAGPDSGH